MLKLRPLAEYPEPDYPCRDYLLEHPELLRLIPKRWRGNPLVHAFLGTALCLMHQSATQAEDKTEKLPQLESRELVMGKFSTPTYLSEADAHKVIQAEAEKAGLSLTVPGGKIENLKIHFIASDLAKKHFSPIEVTLKEIQIDGKDEAKHISFEFLSNKEIQALGELDKSIPKISGERLEPMGFQWATPTSTCTVLSDALDKAEPGIRHGVFYDPAVYPTETKRVQLEQQVREFLAYLKAQGVL